MKKGKLMRIAALFLALMVCFTVLSRAADQMSIAVVTTERPQNMVITHAIKATGKVIQNQDIAVITRAEQRVSAIYVSEGERVTQGQLLFEVDVDLLDEKILYQQQEMEKQQLQVQDAKSQKAVSEMQKANEQAQAAEQYALSAKQADVQLQKAKEQLSDAKNELAVFRESGGSAQPDGSVEEALEKALEEKTQAYLLAQQELSTLQWKIENAVNTALQNIQPEAALTGNEIFLTQSAEEEPVICEEEEDMSQDIAPASDDAQTETESSGGGAVAPEEGSENSGADSIEIVNAEEVSGADEMDVILPEEEAEDSSGADGQSWNVQDNPAQAQTGQNQDSAQVSQAQTGQNQDSARTSQARTDQASMEQIEKTVRDSYSQELSLAQKKVDDAAAEKETAENALSQYQQAYLESADTAGADQEKQLIANVQSAQQAYVEASLAANEAAVTGNRAVQTAGIPNASDSSDRLNEITYEQMELELEKLEELREADGKVFAPADGLIIKINISTGEKTTDDTAILMADLAKGYRFSADITKEQEKYIGAGDLVTISGGSKNQKYEELEVESVMADETDDSIYHVSVQLPEDSLELGASATMDFSKKSDAYSVTVPLSALHLDEKNQYYVLVPQEYDSIMGTETKARKVGVTVLEKNDSYAGLQEGALSSQQEVITGSDKAVDDGSRVRIET